LFEIGLAAIIIWCVWLIQLTLLAKFTLNGVMCNLPLTLTIVWAIVFGSPLKAPSPEEMRQASVVEVFFRQAMAGSVTGLLVGAVFASLFASIIPIYPICYPLVGWLAGYFCLRSFNQASLLVIPIVFIFTLVAEFTMAYQLHILGRPDVFQNLSRIGFPEAVFNSLIGPFLFFPLRGWYEYAVTHVMGTAREA